MHVVRGVRCATHPKSAKRSTFSHKMGQNRVFAGGSRWWGSKSPLLESKRSIFWSPTPLKIDPGYWLQAYILETFNWNKALFFIYVSLSSFTVCSLLLFLSNFLLPSFLLLFPLCIKLDSRLTFLPTLSSPI